MTEMYLLKSITAQKLRIRCLFFIPAILLLFAGCGGSMAPQPAQGSNTPQQSANTITAADVFSPAMIGQTWTFTSDLGDNTFIKILSTPANNSLFPDCIIFQYTKNRARAYWEPGSGGAALQFIL